MDCRVLHEKKSIQIFHSLLNIKGYNFKILQITLKSNYSVFKTFPVHNLQVKSLHRFFSLLWA